MNAIITYDYEFSDEEVCIVLYCIVLHCIEATISRSWHIISRFWNHFRFDWQRIQYISFSTRFVLCFNFCWHWRLSHSYHTMPCSTYMTSHSTRLLFVFLITKNQWFASPLELLPSTSIRVWYGMVWYGMVLFKQSLDQHTRYRRYYLSHRCLTEWSCSTRPRPYNATL